uniref:Uncharacterized protein n=1 Tax=Photinus pyralis TaxID=7054 RepID=A0A1Y1NAT2_PHOPY
MKRKKAKAVLEIVALDCQFMDYCILFYTVCIRRRIHTVYFGRFVLDWAAEKKYDGCRGVCNRIDMMDIGGEKGRITLLYDTPYRWMLLFLKQYDTDDRPGRLE